MAVTGVTLLARITQADIDAAAVTDRHASDPQPASLHPDLGSHSACGHHYGPGAAQGRIGNATLKWLSRDDAFGLLAAARARIGKAERRVEEASPQFKGAARAGVRSARRFARMRRYGGLGTSGPVGTGAWKSRQAAAVYEHVEASEEARKADLLLRMPDLGEAWETARAGSKKRS